MLGFCFSSVNWKRKNREGADMQLHVHFSLSLSLDFRAPHEIYFPKAVSFSYQS